MIPRRTLLVLATSFLFGTAFGWWSYRWYQNRPKTPEDRYQRILNHLSQKLALTPEEKPKMAAVLEGERARIEAVRKDVEGQVKRIHADTVAALRKDLDPEQQKKLDDLEAKFQQRMKDKPDGWRLP